MCDPTVMAVASFATGVMGQVSQYGAAADQAQAQTNAYEQNKINALASMRQDYTQLNTRQLQEGEAAGAEAERRKMAERRELSAARVAAGEGGISGVSVEGLLRDISGLSLNDTDAINRGTDWSIDQLQAEKSGIQTSTQGRITSQSKGIAPSKLGLGLGIVGAGLDSYTGYTDRTGKDPIGDFFSK